MPGNQAKPILWIGAQHEFDAAHRIWLHEPALALDLEADSLYHYHEKVCLIQVSNGRTDWLVDPLSGIRLEDFGQVLVDPAILKVFHGADYDIRSLHRDFGFKFQNLFDTKIAAELLGRTSVSLSDLVMEFFQIRLDKKYQKYDWSRRPLTPEAIEYAAQDTRYLLKIRELLESELMESGRIGWLREEMSGLVSLRWNSNKHTNSRFYRIKNVHRLPEKQKRTLYALWLWRESKACEMDLPPFKIIPDDVLTALAGSAAQNPARDDTLKMVNTRKRNQWGNEILRVLRSAANDVSIRPPEFHFEKPIRLRPRQQARIKQLRDLRESAAARLGLSPGLLSSRDTLTALALFPEEIWNADPDRLVSETGIRKWQWEQFLIEHHR